MCFGTVHGNSTAVGTKADGYSDITRTVSMDFHSDTYLFVDKSNNTTASFVRKAQSLLKKYKDYDVKYKVEAEEIANKVGKAFCRESLNDLNFTLSEYRLNRYELVEKNDFTLPIREIKANTFFENTKRTVTIGYWWIDNNGDERVLIYFDNDSVPMSGKNKLIIFGLIALAIIILILVLFGMR